MGKFAHGKGERQSPPFLVLVLILVEETVLSPGLIDKTESDRSKKTESDSEHDDQEGEGEVFHWRTYQNGTG